MSYTIINTDLDSVESTHPTPEAARAHMHEQCIVEEYRDGKTEIRRTTFGLHHRIRDDATGAWAEHE